MNGHLIYQFHMVSIILCFSLPTVHIRLGGINQGKTTTHHSTELPESYFHIIFCFTLISLMHKIFMKQNKEKNCIFAVQHFLFISFFFFLSLKFMKMVDTGFTRFNEFTVFLFSLFWMTRKKMVTQLDSHYNHHVKYHVTKLP